MHPATADPASPDTARLVLACLDLTSLNDGDTEADIVHLCGRAADTSRGLPAAVCVWPRFAAGARARLPPGVRVAAVANFPDGSTDMARAVRDTEAIVAAGAQEVDVVMPWRALRAGDERAAADVLQAVRAACPGLTLKVIVESGELAAPASIRRAGELALLAGADFLKTSTGKTPRGASLEAADTLLALLAEHGRHGGRAAGFKASGGVRTVADAARYVQCAKAHLGAEALGPGRLRFGASGLLDDIEAVLGRSPRPPAAGGGY